MPLRRRAGAGREAKIDASRVAWKLVQRGGYGSFSTGVGPLERIIVHANASQERARKRGEGWLEGTEESLDAVRVSRVCESGRRIGTRRGAADITACRLARRGGDWGNRGRCGG
jgi:hypothetical protein